MRTRIMGRGDLGLKHGWEMVSLFNQFMSGTEPGDFPAIFVCLVQQPPWSLFVNIDIVRKYPQDLRRYGEGKKFAKYILSLRHFSL